MLPTAPRLDPGRVDSRLLNLRVAVLFTPCLFVLLFCTGGCGSSLDGGGREPSDRTTLDSSVIQDGDGTGGDDATPGPASSDDGTIGDRTADRSMAFDAKTKFCCNPLEIEFYVDSHTLSLFRAQSWHWDFGDGWTGAGASTVHTYRLPGEYDVVLTAKMADGAVERANSTISAGSAGGGESVVIERPPATDDRPPTPGDEDTRPPGEDTTDTADDTIDGPGGDVQPVDDTNDVGQTDPPDGGSDDQTQEPEELRADAGSDQSVYEEMVVKLDGSSTSYTGIAPLTYAWRQTAGVPVELNDPTAVSPTFTAPPTSGSPLVLTWELVVASNVSVSVDTVTIHVSPKTPAPPDERPYGVHIEFLTGPSGVSAPGTAEVSWRFRENRNVTNVYLRRDCCYCPDANSAVLTPDGDGVYRTHINVSSGNTIWYYVMYTYDGIEYASRSTYVNVPPGRLNTEPAPIIWYHIWEFDTQILHDVIRSGIVTHVMISGNDREAVPYDRPEILEAMAICKAAGLKTIWSRHLWNSYGRLQYLEDTVDPATYIDAIDQITFEAEALGADYTAIDGEAYPGSPLDEYLHGDIPEETFRQMAEAISQAATQGKVDFAYPSGSYFRPWRINSLIGPLGRTRIGTSSFYDIPHKICKIDYPYNITGMYVRAHTERPENGDAPFFLPYDAVERRFLWSAADGAPEGVNGLWLYPGDPESEVIQAAKMLADYFDKP